MTPCRRAVWGTLWTSDAGRSSSEHQALLRLPCDRATEREARGSSRTHSAVGHDAGGRNSTRSSLPGRLVSPIDGGAAGGIAGYVERVRRCRILFNDIIDRKDYDSALRYYNVSFR